MNDQQGPEPTRTPDHHAHPTRVRLGRVSAVVVLCGCAILLATVPPTAASFYPKCTFHAATGLHCPGCGLTRAAHALLNGRPLTAISYHLFAPFFFLTLCYVLIRALLDWTFGRTRSILPPVRAFWIWLFVAFLLAYTIARNIPVEPFSRLAPKEIEPDSRPLPR